MRQHLLDSFRTSIFCSWEKVSLFWSQQLQHRVENVLLSSLLNLREHQTLFAWCWCSVWTKQTKWSAYFNISTFYDAGSNLPPFMWKLVSVWLENDWSCLTAFCYFTDFFESLITFDFITGCRRCWNRFYCLFSQMHELREEIENFCDILLQQMF